MGRFRITADWIIDDHANLVIMGEEDRLDQTERILGLAMRLKFVKSSERFPLPQLAGSYLKSKIVGPTTSTQLSCTTSSLLAQFSKISFPWTWASICHLACSLPTCKTFRRSGGHTVSQYAAFTARAESADTAPPAVGPEMKTERGM